MKNSIYSFSAYTLALMLSLSFFVTLFLVFKMNFVVGLSIVGFLAFVIALIFSDGDLIQEIEE